MVYRSSLFRNAHAILTNPRFRLVLIILLVTGLVSLTMTFNRRKYTPHHYTIVEPSRLKEVRYDHLAIALKTGKDVALSRTPIQFLTFLYKIKNVVMVGEAPGVMVGDVPMLDVYSNLYEKTPNRLQPPNRLQKREEQEVKPDENSLGWKSDAHKNIPVFWIDVGLRRIVPQLP
jgi:hypothetical protein